MAKYVEVSRQIRTYMDALTPLVEPISIDEAFLDLTGTQAVHKAPAALSWPGSPRPSRPRSAVNISVGLSHNKFLAKVASDLDKPRGFAVIGAAETLSFLAPKADQHDLRRRQGSSPKPCARMASSPSAIAGRAARKPDAPLWRNGARLARLSRERTAAGFPATAK